MVSAPPVVNRLIESWAASVNQRLPSGPATTPFGVEPASGYSTTLAVAAVAGIAVISGARMRPVTMAIGRRTLTGCQPRNRLVKRVNSLGDRWRNGLPSGRVTFWGHAQ